MNYRILHLGAGVQSGAIYALMADGEVEPADYAVFADTQEEPKWVYEQRDWCKSIGGPPVIEVTAGRIGDDLVEGRNSTGGRFASVPFHTSYQEGAKGGLTRRQCTREYKIEPIERWVRRELLELKPRQRIPKGVSIVSLFGFSTDESSRAVKMQNRMSAPWTADFPLLHEDIVMTRHDCQRYIEERSGFTWRSSRCCFCPLQKNQHFVEIKQVDPNAWDRVLEVDEAIRTTGAVANRDTNEQMYVHRSCRPIKQLDLGQSQMSMFVDDDGCDQGCFL